MTGRRFNPESSGQQGEPELRPQMRSFLFYTRKGNNLNDNVLRLYFIF
jgi:hypothetical protein